MDIQKAARFLESLGETKTATALRKELQTIDLDKNNRMSLMEYFCFKFKKTPAEICNASQGGNTEEMNAAEQQVNECRTQLDDLNEKSAAAATAAELAAAEAEAAAAALEASTAAAQAAAGMRP